MANRRAAIKLLHERFVVGEFLAELNRRHGAAFSVVEEPDPPEAIIRSGRTTRWVEVTTAFWTDEFAKELYSHATPGEQPVNLVDGVHVGPDAKFAQSFVSVVKSKLEKTTYEPFRDMYGPGYLVVSVQYPLYGRWTPEHMVKAWDSLGTIDDRGCFRAIYLLRQVYRSYKLESWRHHRQ